MMSEENYVPKKYKCGDILQLKVDIVGNLDRGDGSGEYDPLPFKAGSKFRVGWNAYYDKGNSLFELVYIPEPDDEEVIYMRQWNTPDYHLIDDNFDVVGFEPWSDEEIKKFREELQEFIWGYDIGECDEPVPVLSV